MAPVTSPPVAFPPSTGTAKLSEFMPCAPLVCSAQVGWKNLIVRTYRLPPGEVALPPVPDPCITVHLSKRIDRIERSFGGIFSRAAIDFDSLTFVPPNHGVYWRWTDEIEILHIHLNHEFIKQHVEQQAGLDVAQLEKVDWFGIQEPLVSQIGRTCIAEIQTCHSCVDNLYIDSLATVLTARLFHRHAHTSNAGNDGSRVNTHGIHAALRYIQGNFDKDISLADLACVANLSLYHFIRRFRTVTGTTPYKYVLNFRIERAKALLKNKSMSIIEIGQSSGFPSQSHFTNTFRRQVGVTPTNYRRNCLG